MRKLLCSLACVAMIIGASSVAAAPTGGSAKAYVTGHEWGPAVSKIIVKTDAELGSLDASYFKVSETKEEFNWAILYGVPGDAYVTNTTARSVTKAYYSDANGNEVSKNEGYVTLDVEYSPTVGGAFMYDFVGSTHNEWPNNYGITVKYNGKELVNTEDAAEFYAPEYSDNWTSGTYAAKAGKTLTYASYAPSALKSDSGKNPLYVWLHGAGEGGTDPAVAVLGNEILELSREDFQTTMGGAYVLAPQSPTMWMDHGNGTSDYTTDGTSIYTESLMELIKDYVSKNPDIDTDRIYLGGCSNGGYMTMKLLIDYPGYFAAATPCAEAYSDAWISDAQIKELAKTPIWFTHSSADPTVEIKGTSIGTYNRLFLAGTKENRISVFPHVVDTSYTYANEDGSKPYAYMSDHWSWIYFLNNECVSEGETVFEWLAKQKLSNNAKAEPVATTPATSTTVETAPATTPIKNTAASLLDRLVSFVKNLF